MVIVDPAECTRYTLWRQGLPHSLRHRLAGRRLCVRSCTTVGGLTGNTHAVARLPLAFVHDPLDKRWLHVMGVALVRECHEQRPPALWVRTALRSWLPGRRRALPNESGPVAIGAGPP